MKIYPSAGRVALRLAILLKRTQKTRARISEKTFKILAERATLRDAFIVSTRNELEDLGVVSFRLERGGFALIAASALEGAPQALVKKIMPGFKKLSEDDLFNELELAETESEE